LFALFAVFQTSPNSLATQMEVVLTRSAHPADFSLATTTMTEALVSRNGGENGLNKECRGVAEAFLAQRIGIPRLNCGTFTEFVAAKGVGGAVDDIYVIGRQVDTAVAKDWAGHKILDIPNWTLKKNDAWTQGIIDSQAKVYIGTPQTPKTLWDAVNNRPTVFSRELDQLRGAGYKQVGDYMHPPGN
jgi:hypothetical protein